jgi:hypothetical protein
MEVKYMSTGIKKLKDKYFVKEEDGGYKLNKEEAKKSAQSAMFDAILLGVAAAGTLCVIGLARIGLQTLKLGATTVREGKTIVASHFRK